MRSLMSDAKFLALCLRFGDVQMHHPPLLRDAPSVSLMTGTMCLAQTYTMAGSLLMSVKVRPTMVFCQMEMKLTSLLRVILSR